MGYLFCQNTFIVDKTLMALNKYRTTFKRLYDPSNIQGRADLISFF